MQISALTVRGFKSIFDEQRVETSRLTIFAGANSGGKSSASLPLLLLKQTMDCPYDPGALLLNGPNVKFTSASQLLSRGGGMSPRRDFSVGFEDSSGWQVKLRFELPDAGSIKAKRVDVRTSSGKDVSYSEGAEFGHEAKPELVQGNQFIDQVIDSWKAQNVHKVVWRAVQARCFPDLTLGALFDVGGGTHDLVPLYTLPEPQWLRRTLKDVIHIRGLRGNPERSYPASAGLKGGFPGAFEDYVASILLHWQSSNPAHLDGLGADLRDLGLTWKVRVKKIQDTHAEIKVGRLRAPTKSGANDLVSLADVGLGVSQILPFLVALRVAKKGQLIFVEQPEIHLHPRAQFQLAKIIATAAKRGVVVWVETHSSVLIRGIQALMADQFVGPELVAFNWFERDSISGKTKVVAVRPDASGRVPEWPADFDAVSMEANRAFLDAVTRARAKSNG